MEIRKRYHLLDVLRGLTLISMILYHGKYDLTYIYGIPDSIYTGRPGYIWQQSICWSFILLSGMCWSFDRNPLKRGIIISIAGLVITLATWIFMPEQFIFFGILSFFGAAVLLMIPLKKLLLRIPSVPGAVIGFLLFLFTKNIQYGELGFGRLFTIALTDSFYRLQLLAPLGFPPAGFASSDYFPLLPWFLLFVTGFFIWRLLLQCRADRFFTKPVCRPLSLIGRHTLFIYMLHQPVLMGLFIIADKTGIL